MSLFLIGISVIDRFCNTKLSLVLEVGVLNTIFLLFLSLHEVLGDVLYNFYFELFFVGMPHDHYNTLC